MTQPQEPYGSPYPPQPPQPGVYGSAVPPEHYGPPPGSPAYGEPPAYGQSPAYGQPSAYGQPPAYGQSPAYGPPGQPDPTQAYGAPGSPAYGQPYGAPAPASPAYGQPYGAPAPASPAYGQPYGAPAPASPAYGTGAVQPYSAPPQPYATQPYPAAGAVTGWQAEHPQYRLVTPGGRLGAVLLDFVLSIVTLFIGWFIWSLIVWSRGQTPGKQLLGHVVAEVNTGRPVGWGQMFLREFVIRGLLFGFIVNSVTFGVFGIVDACMVFGKDHRTIHDMVAGTVVRYADI
jgi:hypothetical protein